MRELVHSTWEDTIQKKRDQRASLVTPFLVPVNTKNAIAEEILENGDITSLVDLFSSGKLKAKDLIQAYVEK
jgi:hypothetical protein